MTYAGIQTFMEKLSQLINCKNNPLFNNPTITCEKPQFQLLHQDLASMVHTLFIDEHQDLEKVNKLKKQFTDAVHEAQYIVDLFLSGVHIRNNGNFPTCFEDFNPSLNLDDVKRSFSSVKVELMKIDSSPIPQRMLNESAVVAPRNSLRSKKIPDVIIVGIDHDAELIRDKLVEDQKKLDVVSIVGMGGIGKTTLATKVFNDDYVKYHFHVRVWVTVSQTYNKRDVLIQILESVGVELDLERDSDLTLREKVHKNLIGKRYLIVVDDIWNVETWDSLKLFFPHDNRGSRILVTSRLIEVAKHANSDGLIHHLGSLDNEKSWKLLSQKVFHGNEIPEWSIEPGMQIVESCRGLPLAVVVIAGVLAKEAWSESFWLEIAYRTGLYIVGDQNGCLETLALSYNHLPIHLRECFLYLGGFPEDYKFQVQRLILLWVAEGFIEQDGNRSLEEIAETYLMDLIDRNLLIVSDRRKSNGAVRACILHDLVRELCRKKAMEERFILQTERVILSNVITSSHETNDSLVVRMFINKDINILSFPYRSTQNVRSILCYAKSSSLRDDIAKCFFSFVLLRVLDLDNCWLNSFMLLRVLDLDNCWLDDFPKGIELLVHLRYLAICNLSKGFPSSICNLWNLQTLIYNTSNRTLILPGKISHLVNLRHMWSYSQSSRRKVVIFLPSLEKPMKLQTISFVNLGDKVDNLQKCYPYIKKLTCIAYIEKEYDFKSLTCLEKLRLVGVRKQTESTLHDSPNGGKNRITFPATLKSLTLSGARLPWSDMSIIQSLPNLQVLKLGYKAFEGSCWNAREQEFRQLKFLRLQALYIKRWKVCSTSFPCLKQLEIFSCHFLEEIPLEIGDIPTLELIKVKCCSHSIVESVRRIQQEQQNLGNYDLKIGIIEGIRSF